MRTYIRTKVRGTVTGVDLDYDGSLTLGRDLFKGFEEGEQVDVVNVNNGQRFTTYLIMGITDQIILNGAAARLGMPGDKVIIMAYELRGDQMTEQELRENIADTYRSFSFWQDKHYRSVSEFELKFNECSDQILTLVDEYYKNLYNK